MVEPKTYVGKIIEHRTKNGTDYICNIYEVRPIESKKTKKESNRS